MQASLPLFFFCRLCAETVETEDKNRDVSQLDLTLLRAFLFSLCLIFTTSLLDNLSIGAYENEARKRTKKETGGEGRG